VASTSRRFTFISAIKPSAWHFFKSAVQVLQFGKPHANASPHANALPHAMPYRFMVSLVPPLRILPPAVGISFQSTYKLMLLRNPLSFL
jgi:hypothetical protein